MTPRPSSPNRRSETAHLKRIPIAYPVIASLGAAVASCGTSVVAYPRAQDLAVEAKPVPSDDVMTRRIAGEQYDNAVEARGEAG